MPLSRLPLIGLILLAFSCTKKDIPGPAGPQGPAGAAGANNLLQGPLTGKVMVYDTTGILVTDQSGASVSLENTTRHLTTAADGSFTFDTLNAGIYSLSVQKQGFGTMRYFNITNTGAQSVSRAGTLALTQIMSSNFDLKALIIDSSSKPNLNFNVILAHPRHLPNATLFFYFSDSTGVGTTHNKYVLDAGWTQLNDSTLTTAPYPVSLASWYPQLAKAGAIYITAALDNWYANGYKDEQGNYISPSAAKQAPEVILNNAQHIY